MPHRRCAGAKRRRCGSILSGSPPLLRPGRTRTRSTAVSAHRLRSRLRGHEGVVGAAEPSLAVRHRASWPRQLSSLRLSCLRCRSCCPARLKRILFCRAPHEPVGSSPSAVRFIGGLPPRRRFLSSRASVPLRSSAEGAPASVRASAAGVPALEGRWGRSCHRRARGRAGGRGPAAARAGAAEPGVAGRRPALRFCPPPPLRLLCFRSWPRCVARLNANMLGSTLLPLNPQPMHSQLANTVSDRAQHLRSSKLEAWRKRYSKREYPAQVAKSLLLEALSSWNIYQDIQPRLGQRVFDSIDAAMSALLQMKVNNGRFMVSKIDQAYGSDISVARIQVPSLRTTATRAQRGDSKAVEDLEFGYVLNMITFDMIMKWMALSVSGMDPVTAFNGLSPDLKKGNLPSKYEELVDLFALVINGVPAINGATANGESLLSVAYQPLPMLWK